MDFRQSNKGLTGPVPGKVHPCWIHGGKSPEKSLLMWKYQHSTVAKVSKALHEGYLELTQQSPPPRILPLWHHSGITFYLQQYLGYSYICISGIVIIQFRCWHNALTQISDEKGSSPQLIVTGQGNSLCSWGGGCLDFSFYSFCCCPQHLWNRHLPPTCTRTNNKQQQECSSLLMPRNTIPKLAFTIKIL